MRHVQVNVHGLMRSIYIPPLTNLTAYGNCNGNWAYADPRYLWVRTTSGCVSVNNGSDPYAVDHFKIENMPTPPSSRPLPPAPRPPRPLPPPAPYPSSWPAPGAQSVVVYPTNDCTGKQVR